MSLKKPSKRLFCFGYGYVARYLTAALDRNEWDVLGTTRDPLKRTQLKQQGVQAYLFDEDHPMFDPLYVLEGVTHILISVPPKDRGDLVYSSHIEDIKKISTLEWVGYLSATSVYGDRGGAWVSEKDEPKPTSKRGSRRLKAEEQWRREARIEDIPAHIFRIAGIYGPERNVFDSLRAGMARRISRPGHAFNRIHIEDIVRILKASMDKPSSGEVYNVSDDNPAESDEVTAFAANMLGITPPPLVPFDQANLPPMARSFYSDNKRIDNSKVKEVFDLDLSYPDYRKGLQACLDQEDEVSVF